MRKISYIPVFVQFFILQKICLFENRPLSFERSIFEKIDFFLVLKIVEKKRNKKELPYLEAIFLFKKKHMAFF